MEQEAQEALEVPVGLAGKEALEECSETMVLMPVAITAKEAEEAEEVMVV